MKADVDDIIKTEQKQQLREILTTKHAAPPSKHTHTHTHNAAPPLTAPPTH